MAEIKVVIVAEVPSEWEDLVEAMVARLPRDRETGLPCASGVPGLLVAGLVAGVPGVLDETFPGRAR